jgi:hypothetical protein
MSNGMGFSLPSMADGAPPSTILLASFERFSATLHAHAHHI